MPTWRPKRSKNCLRLKAPLRDTALIRFDSCTIPAVIKKTHTVTAEQAGRIDRVVAVVGSVARKSLKPVFDTGSVSVNGKVVEGPWVQVAAGDQLVIDWDPNRKVVRSFKAWKDAAFSIVYEDEHLLVVNKTASILTVPAHKGQSKTLIHRVGAYLIAQAGGKPRRAFVVHRLDLGVSGLLLVGKSQEIADQLRNQFEARKPEREYVAIVAGKMLLKAGTFQSMLITEGNLHRRSSRDPNKGELAITHYQQSQMLPGEYPATVVRVRLETGRRNQIRVHFAEAGHPVIGDPRYEPVRAKHPRWRITRMALHAQSLGITHPVTGQHLQFTSALPAPMQRFMEGGICGAPDATHDGRAVRKIPLRGKSPRGRSGRRD